ncbi:aminotransferase class I/II-fold pyridoxal phosphate-dependent enzyme [Bacillus shivajii]|uniref:aminotransferase class I/II-fold pyridoxal phosphate-dependent enzyme n=1 Tax=Bacillus shivajii TaxID=1983719 RepID=UPI001CFB95C9|nr:aminotransferase class I/II-fold pyridoxal phosphate-dependent enzyme [Bacillus shivajii]UCZ53288.1 aminotransferase class I/II-fold pyridoxal phosphate-dependent enzyme [Bacillus shivajii]
MYNDGSINEKVGINMDQSKTPLFDHLMKHAKAHAHSFHVPGHKNGKLFHENGQNLFRSILQIDVTEISGMDDLHHPSGIIFEAQQLTAALYGVDESFFLVGGTTVGNLAMILSTVKSGEYVLVQRNSHQSIFHGIELSGAKPVFLEPDIDANTELPLGVSVETVKKAVKQYPNARALLLTNPTYEGYGQLLKEHITIAHEQNIPVLVDEAHGAHLVFEGEHWPESAIRAGADVVVQSTHKMLPAMTMTSFLHKQNDRVDLDQIKYYLKVLQSSSPSYPLLASLDLARAYLAEAKLKHSDEITNTALTFKHSFKKGDGWITSSEKIDNYTQDPLKILFTSINKQTGYEWGKKLERMNVYPEFTTPKHVLFTLPLSRDVDPKSLERVKTVFLDEMKEVESRSLDTLSVLQKRTRVSEAVLSSNQLSTFTSRHIPYKEAVGYVAAETITPYPPGVPLICKGEIITEEHCYHLENYKVNGGYFQTGDDWIRQGIRVVNLHR